MRELDVGAAHHLDGLGDAVGIVLEPRLQFGCDGKHGCGAERVAGVDPHGVDILDEAHRDHVVLGIADDLEFEFLPTEDRLFYQHLADHAGGQSPPGHLTQLVDVVDEAATRATQGVRGAHHHGETQVGGDRLSFLHRVGGLAPRHLNPQTLHQLLEYDAIFAAFDRIDLDADDLDMELVQNPCFGQL